MTPGAAMGAEMAEQPAILRNLIAQRNEAPDDEDEIGEKYNYEDGGGAAHIENGAENGAEA